MHWLTLILAAFAYRGLATLEAATAASDGEWAFVPSDTAPGLVLALSGWLVFRRLGRLRALPAGPAPAWVWAPLLLAAGGTYLWATLAAAPDLLAPSLMFAGLGYASLLRGSRAVRVMTLPAAFLLFAIPPPAPLLNEIVFRLQIWSAEYAGWILFLLGVPALVEGELVAQADAAFKVIETCSGFRSVVTLMMLAIVLSDLFRRPARHVIAMLALAPFVGFFLNGFRVAGLILNPHSAISEIHDLQGVVILLAGLIVLYALDGLLVRVLRSDPGPEPTSPGGSATGPLLSWPLFLVPALLAATIALSLLVTPFEPWQRPFRVAVLKPLGEEISNWSPERRDTDMVFMGSTGFFSHTHQRFTRGKESVDVFVAVGDHDQRRMRSVFSPKMGLPGGGWTIQEQAIRQVGHDGLEVWERVVRSGKHLRLVYHWYAGTPGRTSEVLRTLAALDHGPFPRAADPFTVRISTSMDGTGEEARIDAEDRLLEFYHLLRPRLDQLESVLSLSQQS